MAVEFQFSCPLPNGLHARPASHLADVAQRFASRGTLTNIRLAAKADLKSVLSLIAAGVNSGDRCVVRMDGADEAAASAALRRFIDQELPKLDEPVALPPRAGALPASFEAAGVEATGVRAHFGTPVSSGVGQGKAVIVSTIAVPRDPPERAADPAEERPRAELALRGVRAAIEKSLSGASGAEAAILSAHLAIANDISLAAKIADRIEQGWSAMSAIAEAGETFAAVLRGSDSAYIRERAGDVEEICLLLLEQIQSAEPAPAPELAEASVIVAESLAPQQFLALHRAFLKGLVLETGSTTSHLSILARSLGVPMVAGVKDARTMTSPGKELLVDATRGFVIVEPGPTVREFYERERKAIARREASLAARARTPAATRDGRVMEVAANISSAEEALAAFEKGADGVGLYRTEMLFLERDSAPSEEEQFAAYEAAVRAGGGKPVIIRTMDIGGDKPASYLRLPAETNPFLGLRGARIYAAHKELVETQIRAIVRASASGPVWLMAPMISSVEEARWIKARLAACSSPGAGGIRLGVMIEVPAAAFLIDRLAAEVDFFSIGTNDLCQYFFAADRGNPSVARLASVRHPAFLAFLQQITARCRAQGKWIGMCGEMAADLRSIPLLIALGLDELSVAVPAIPAVKARVRAFSVSSCRALLDRALACESASEVDSLLSPETPLLDPELVVFDSACRNKAEAIRALADVFFAAGRTEDPELLEHAVSAREAIYSTGLGHGFAVPHCSSDAVKADSIGVMKLERPIDWGSLDGKPVQMILLLALRASQKNGTHLRIFSSLARKLMDEEFRNQLMTVQDASSVVARLSRELEINT